MSRWRRWHGASVFVAALTLSALAEARDLADALSSPLLRRLEISPIGDVLASTVAQSYPVASESTSVAYRYDPETGAFERRTPIPDPVIGERAETLGARQIDVGLSYAFVDLAEIDGQDLDALENRPRLGDRVVSRRFPEGKELRDGRFAGFLPVQVRLGIDIQAHLATPSVTYGVTPDLDVNVALPLVHTSLAVKTTTRTPDPRLPQFALPAGDKDAGTAVQSTSDDATGVGDLLFRAKYVALRDRPVDVALGLGLSVPTGREGDFHGSGRVRLVPLLIASKSIGDRVEPFLNLGTDIDVEDPGRSIVRWAAGATGRITDALALSTAFLGRHELGLQADRIRFPFFFQIRRNDIIDASIGLRFRFAERGFVGLSALLPVNRDGLRAEVIPIAEVQYALAAHAP